jgi:HSP20 family protein
MMREELVRLLKLLDKLDAQGSERSGIATDVWMSDSEVLIRFEVPGADPDSLRLSGHRCFVELSGTRRAQTPRGGRYLVAERLVGPFRKAVELPIPVDLSHVSAVYAEGLMTVRVPRVEERRGERRALDFIVNES